MIAAVSHPDREAELLSMNRWSERHGLTRLTGSPLAARHSPRLVRDVLIDAGGGVWALQGPAWVAKPVARIR
jgi:hypothetical protein